MLTGKVVINWDGTIYLVPWEHILFVEKSGRKSLIHTRSKKYEVIETLGTLLERLDRRVFVQTHRSYIINFENVLSIKPSGDTNLVYFSDYPEPAYISKNKMNEIMKRLK